MIKFKKISFKEKIIQIKRVTKVTKGRKKMTFRVIILVGNKSNKVGLGIGRSQEVSFAIKKASINAKKNLMSINLTYFLSIPHIIQASYGASIVNLRPTSIGTGIVASQSIRTILEFIGIKNILVNQLGSSNILNNLKATLLALTRLNEYILLKRNQLYLNEFFYNKILKRKN